MNEGREASTEWTEYRVVCTPHGDPEDATDEQREAWWTRVIDKPYMGGDLAQSARQWADHCDGKDDPESTYHSSCRPHHVESRVVTATPWVPSPARETTR